MPGYDSWANFEKRFSSTQKWTTDKGLTKTGDSSSLNRWINSHPEPNDDFAAPYLENRNPVPGAQVDKYAFVNFDVVDDGNGIPLYGITIRLEGALAFDGSDFVAPYDGANSKYVRKDSGRRWSFTIDKTGAWPALVDVTVQVIATDYWSNTLNTSYSFEGDSGAPYIDNEIPERNGYIENQGLLSFDIMDDNALVDPAAVDAYVEGSLALDSDGTTWTFHAPYNGASSDAYAIQIGDDYGYHICLDRTTDYGGDFAVVVYADDYRGNSLVDTWYINTFNGPFLRDHSPSDDSTCNSASTTIAVNVVDDGYVLQNSIDAYVNGAWAYDGVNDVFKYPYNDSGSSIVPVSVDGYDGYTITIDSYNDFGATVNVRILAEDNASNTLDDDTYDFTCDIVAPSNFNPFPASGSTSNELDALVRVSPRDYCSGVDLTTVMIYVDGSLAYDGSTNTWNAPWNGAGSTRDVVSNGANIYIDHATGWAEDSSFTMQLDAYDNVGNFLSTSWSWATLDLVTTFEADFSSGIDNLDTDYDFNGDARSPTLLYHAIDGTIYGWDAYGGYGERLLVNGSTPWMNVLNGSPLNVPRDDSIKYNLGKQHYAPTASTGDATTHDMVVELVVKTSTAGLSGPTRTIVNKGSSSGGYVVTQSYKHVVYDYGTTLTFSVYGTGGSKAVSTNALKDNTWYHIIFIYDSNGYLYCLVNGDLHNTTLAGGVGSITTGARFIIGHNFDSNVAYVGVWIRFTWVAGTDAQIENYARERFMKLIGTFPSIALGSTVPYANSRSSPASMSKWEGSAYKLYEVGDNWIRVERVADSSNIEHEGVRIERGIENNVGFPIDFTQSLVGVGGGYWRAWSSWSPATASVAAYPSSADSGPAEDGDVYSITELAGDGTAQYHGLSYSFVDPAANEYCTCSVFAKEGNKRYMYFAVNSSGGFFVNRIGAIFDLRNGEVTDEFVEGSGDGVVSASVEPYINGWYRCSFTYLSYGIVGNPSMFVALSQTSHVSGAVYIGTTVNNAILVYGAQHESDAAHACPTSFHRYAWEWDPYALMWFRNYRIADTLRYQGGNNAPNDGDENYIDANVISTCNTPGAFKEYETYRDCDIVTLVDSGGTKVTPYVRANNQKAALEVGAATAFGPNIELWDGDEHEIQNDYWLGHTQVAVDSTDGSEYGLLVMPGSTLAINIGRDSTAADYLDGIITYLRIHKEQP